MKIIAFNGPPRSGKDTLKELIINEFVDKNIKSYTLSDILIEATCVIYGIVRDEWDDRYCTDMKDEPWELLFGLSQRQALIGLAEEYLKPKHGGDIIAKIFLKRLEYFNESGRIDVLLIDTGFSEEFKHIVSKFGVDNVMLIRVKRNGRDYSNDSRSDVEPVDMDNQLLKNFGIIKNNYSIEWARCEISTMVEKFIDG